jgi:hypothetical protein
LSSRKNFDDIGSPSFNVSFIAKEEEGKKSNDNSYINHEIKNNNNSIINKDKIHNTENDHKLAHDVNYEKYQKNYQDSKIPPLQANKIAEKEKENEIILTEELLNKKALLFDRVEKLTSNLPVDKDNSFNSGKININIL